MRISDWSSDVCSSDLGRLEATRDRPSPPARALMPDPRRPCAISQQSSPRLRSGGRARLRGVMSMAQFQILCPHSEAEWRPITIEFIFAPNGEDRKSVGKGKSVSVRVDLGGRRIIKKKKKFIKPKDANT